MKNGKRLLVRVHKKNDLYERRTPTFDDSRFCDSVKYDMRIQCIMRKYIIRNRAFDSMTEPDDIRRA